MSPQVSLSQLFLQSRSSYVRRISSFDRRAQHGILCGVFARSDRPWKAQRTETEGQDSKEGVSSRKRTRKKEAFQLLSPVLTDGTGESEEERDGEREKIILLSTVIALTNLCPKATEKSCFLWSSDTVDNILADWTSLVLPILCTFLGQERTLVAPSCPFIGQGRTFLIRRSGRRILA